MSAKEPFFPPVISAWRTASSRLVVQQGLSSVETESFIEAAEMMAEIADSLGRVFTVLRTDMLNNVKKVRKVLLASPDKPLREIVRGEVMAQRHKSEDAASVGLQWLHRELHFLFLLLEKLTRGVEARAAASEAYQEALAAFHDSMLQRTFRWGLWAGAGTDAVLASLGGRQSRDTTNAEAQTLVLEGQPVLDALRALLLEAGVEDPLEAPTPVGLRVAAAKLWGEGKKEEARAGVAGHATPDMTAPLRLLGRDEWMALVPLKALVQRGTAQGFVTEEEGRFCLERAGPTAGLLSVGDWSCMLADTLG
ncbi:glycolipid transfer protein domain-containing protein, partial [Baffinella frigidus]